MVCKRTETDELIESYLTGKLDEAGREEFESHLSSCRACAERLEVFRAIQEELLESEEDLSPISIKRDRPPARRWAYAAGASALIVLVMIVVIWRPRGIFGPSAGPSAKRPALELLAFFEAPLYLPARLRGGSDEAGEKFRAGMDFYRKGDFVQAIPDLQSAAALAPREAHIHFFLGISLLLSERIDAGIDELKKVLSLGDTAYLDEARFYLAKGLLHKGHVSGAKAELKILAESGGKFREEALRLLKLLE